jgi:hypothetical protein
LQNLKYVVGDLSGEALETGNAVFVLRSFLQVRDGRLHSTLDDAILKLDDILSGNSLARARVDDWSTKHQRQERNEKFETHIDDARIDTELLVMNLEVEW